MESGSIARSSVRTLNSETAVDIGNEGGSEKNTANHAVNDAVGLHHHHRSRAILPLFSLALDLLIPPAVVKPVDDCRLDHGLPQVNLSIFAIVHTLFLPDR
jgi:hypothetical protein